MSTIYVALDLETTGLNPNTAEIIEIGAVKFSDDRELGRFSTFVKPFRPLPLFIQRLTGIRPADLHNAPLFAEVASSLEEFIADHPVVGQNVSFDLAFLAAQSIEPPGPTFDTYELAALLLHGLPDYSLRALAERLGVDFPVRHRAVADAEAARQVFLRLRSRLGELPVRTLAELQQIAAAVDWPLAHLFSELLGEAPLLSETGPGDDMPPPVEIGAPLVPKATPTAVSPDDVEAILSSPQQRPELFPCFELRKEQLAMAREAAETLNAGGQLIVEAGTGIGKSLAYLAPAACYAIRNDARVVVSTDTINLQEQLMGKDIPLLQRLLEGWKDKAAYRGLRFSQMKGRRNYLCLLRLAGLRRSESLTLAEARLLARIVVWLRETATGDRAELRMSPPEEVLWRSLSADSEECYSSTCHYARHGACFLHRARRRAEASHVVVVNHALLLSDAATEGHVLPEYRHVIIDEAHNLEEEATQAFGFQASDSDLAALLDRVHHRAGRSRSGGLVESLRQTARFAATTQEVVDVAAELAAANERARSALPVLFDLLTSFLFDRAAQEGDYDRRLLINRSMRVQPAWSQIEIAWENLDLPMQRLAGLLVTLVQTLGSQDEAPPGVEELFTEATGILQEANRLRNGLSAILTSNDESTIAWMTYGRSSASVMLFSAPLEVAGILRSRLFEQKESAVLTSATLTVANRFDYVSRTLGLDEPRELQLGSPFDYARSTLLLLPSDLPEPSSASYQPALEQSIIDLCIASEGRALVLFTSHGALGATYSAVAPRLEEEGILVLGQGIDGSPKSLLNALRENRRTVIFGTSSFWEGVDVAGEALSLLAIARLPFAVPSDPVFTARSALYDDSFNEYALPQAVLRFRQGFGRLIRRKTDRGVVAVLDRRIRSKAYGDVFLRSLPPCRIEEAAMRDLGSKVEAWLTKAAEKG